MANQLITLRSIVASTLALACSCAPAYHALGASVWPGRFPEDRMCGRGFTQGESGAGAGAVEAQAGGSAYLANRAQGGVGPGVAQGEGEGGQRVGGRAATYA